MSLNTSLQAHVLRNTLLEKMSPKYAMLRLMSDLGKIVDENLALATVSYALMEMGLFKAMEEGTVLDPIQVLRDLFESGNPADYVYQVREQEGQGWEGPKVRRWMKACEDAQTLMKASL